MSTEANWLKDRIKKLQKRLVAQRAFGRGLQNGSALRRDCDRIAFDMEKCLAGLQRHDRALELSLFRDAVGVSIAS